MYEERKTVSVKLRPSVWKTLKVLCALNGESLYEALERIIEAEAKKKEEKA